MKVIQSEMTRLQPVSVPSEAGLGYPKTGFLAMKLILFVYKVYLRKTGRCARIRLRWQKRRKKTEYDDIQVGKYVILCVHCMI